MPATLTLTRRRTQLEVLERACAMRQRVLLLPADKSQGRAIEGTLLALEPDGLLVTWPTTGLGPLTVHGTPVHGLFAWDNRTLGFRSQTCGRVWHLAPGGGDIEALKLTLPLRVERREERRRNRLVLGGPTPVPLQCTSVADDHRHIAAELSNISFGGLSARARGVSAMTIQRGALYWTCFDLPGLSRRFEFVVRIAHVRHNPATSETSFGGSFIAGEDPTPHRQQLDAIAEFIASRAALRAARREGA
ncbi:MAG: hypothetical protein IPM18_01895 [Phycisphaerales bacterium]|nr:hypothetical protein [Phycisphaerales bacterium]